MLHNLTFEKAKEVIRLAEQARLAPDERADDPHRGGPGDDDGLARPSPPPEPQPARTWTEAFRLYLHDLSDDALAELIALYQFGRNATVAADVAVPNPEAGGMSHGEKIDFLLGREDLVVRLEAALARL